MLTVAATDGEDRLAPFSNYGSRGSVHLAAPGLDILSLFPGDWLAYMSGTSVAAPFVAGAAAFLMALSGGQLSAPEARRILLETARPVDGLGNATVTGGMLDLAAAAARVAAGAADEEALLSPSLLPAPIAPGTGLGATEVGGPGTAALQAGAESWR